MENIYQYFIKNKFLCLSVLLFIATISLGMLYFKEASAEEAFHCPVESNDEYLLEEDEEIKETLQIDVKGAVRTPGVYEVEEGAVVNDVLELAGGLLDNADTRNLNLSKKLEDEMVIYVYTKEEVDNKLNNKYEDEDANIDDELLNDESIIYNKNKDDKNNSSLTGKISLNTATLEELTTLPGIGESKAKSIIEYRQTCGAFKKIEDIKNISGIGDIVYSRLKEYITV